jgi:hypothetical protein
MSLALVFKLVGLTQVSRYGIKPPAAQYFRDTTVPDEQYSEFVQGQSGDQYGLLQCSVYSTSPLRTQNPDIK